MISPGPPLTPTREAARQAAQHELSRGEYHLADEPWWLQLLHWLLRRLDRLSAQAGEAVPGGWVTIVVLLVVLAALVVVIRLRFGPLARAGRSGDQPLFGEAVRTAAEHRAAAAAHASSGEWALALREQLRGLVRGLEERGLLDERPGRTADEAAAEVGRAFSDAGLTAAMRRAAADFDAVWYGSRPATAAMVAAVRDLDADLQRRRVTVEVGV